MLLRVESTVAAAAVFALCLLENGRKKVGIAIGQLAAQQLGATVSKLTYENTESMFVSEPAAVALTAAHSGSSQPCTLRGLITVTREYP